MIYGGLIMVDQQKIGGFLKQLRMENEMTQKQLADYLNISNRSISRWETGVNMPDLSMLKELSEFYHVDIMEILNGERNDIKKETETLKTIIAYQNIEKENLKKKMIHISTGIIIIFFITILIQNMDGLGIFMSESTKNVITFISGMLFGSLLLNCLYLAHLWFDRKRINEL